MEPLFRGAPRFNGSTAEILEGVDNTIGAAQDVAEVVHMGIDLTCAAIFVAALTAGHVVLHVVLLILGVGDDSVTVNVMAGQRMLEAGTADHVGSGEAESGGAKGFVQANGCFHGRVCLEDE